jgi:hypothetical protein
MTVPANPPGPAKEGLQTALDYTKYLLTLAGGAIAFVIQPSFFSGNYQVKLWSMMALVSLTICVISGLFVFSGGGVMLSRNNYDLEHLWVKIPGLINVLTFSFGFICVAVAVGIKLVHVTPFRRTPLRVGYRGACGSGARRAKGSFDLLLSFSSARSFHLLRPENEPRRRVIDRVASFVSHRGSPEMALSGGQEMSAFAPLVGGKRTSITRANPRYAGISAIS